MQTMQEGNFNRNDLLKKAMNKDWVSVIEEYKNNRSVRRAKLTRTENTVLHLAVLQKDDNVVEQLVNAINDDEASEILKLKNNLGDTPLHVAAALGLAKICVLLVDKWDKLVVSARNSMGETPLYVAVHYGKKEAFFVLQDYVPTSYVPWSLMSDDLSFCWRGDGNTILHAAVHGTYFGIKVDRLELKYQPGYTSYRIKREVEELCVRDSPTEPRFFNTVINFLKTVINFLKTVIKVLIAPFRIDILEIETTKRKKTMHEHANQVMKELINLSSYWVYGESDKMPNTLDVESSTNNSESLEGENMQIKRQPKDEDKEAHKPMRDSPILVAAKRGIVEMVENILDTYPEAIEDLDSNHKNIILLSAEHRQLNVYKHLMGRRPRRDSIFAVVDKDGNNALHLAADTAGYNS